jgi:CRISPR-associated endonuclease Cas1
MFTINQTCAHCGKLFFAAHVVHEHYCSQDCYYLATKHPGKKRIADTAPVAPPDDAVNEVDDEELGRAWQLAGIRFDAFTQRALAQEKRSTDKRSIILCGKGAGLSVKNDKLIVKCGISYEPQELIAEELDRAMHGVWRIVWAGATGNFSYTAVRWCYQQNIDLVILNSNGNTILESHPNKSADIQLRRAQYTIQEERSYDIAMWIMLAKIMCQSKTYHDNRILQNHRTASIIASELSALTSGMARNIDDIRLIEARVANVYFEAYRDVPLKWHMADIKKIPAHWCTMGNRNSPLANDSARKPVSPGQAILNYAYGILEHMSRVALLACGFDISVGIVHADKTGRDSLVYDLMELQRGVLDNLVLEFLRKIEFRKGDFIQIPSGEVRLHPELCRAVAAVCTIPYEPLLEKAQTLRNIPHFAVWIDRDGGIR